MNQANHRYALLILIFAVILVGVSCSELQEDLVSPSPRAQTLTVHPDGWSGRDVVGLPPPPPPPNFHGNYIRAQEWQMSSCWSCHGRDYEGGITQISCKTCHSKPGGPENCTTCHGSTNAAPPRDISRNRATTARGVGAHQAHLLGSSTTDGVRCSECHRVPRSVYVPGHVDSGLPAEIMFADSIANVVTNEPGTIDYDLSLPTFRPMSKWDPGTLRCSNTYCHGYFKNGNNYSPAWTSVGTGEARCGTCHGDVTRATLAERALPKTSARGGTHPNTTQCSVCHVGVVDANLSFIDKTKHINGRLNVFGTERDF